jgi:preprotein translocase subunit SecG
MLNTLLFIHLVVALLLVVVVLLQKTSTDGLSGIGGGGNNMGLMSGRSTANFLTKTTIILGAAFFANAILLANLSSQSGKSTSSKIEKLEQLPFENSALDTSLPIAK